MPDPDAKREKLPSDGEFSHAGLVLSRYLRAHETKLADKTRRRSSETLMLQAIAASHRVVEGGSNAVYAAAHRRNLARLIANVSKVFRVRTPPNVRLVLGLGNDVPLDSGLTLHHTYGVPFIPGSALKGLASHYCEHLRVSRDVQRLVFGDTESAGWVIFEDAWIEPQSLMAAAGEASESEGLLLDVLTPHHGDYNGAKCYHAPGEPIHDTLIPPTEFDNPLPVPFLSVRGSFSVALGWNDAPPASGVAVPKRDELLGFAKAVLIVALAEWGIGGKTSSGYGRLDMVGERRRANSEAEVTFIGHDITDHGVFRVQELGKPEGIVCAGRTPNVLPLAGSTIVVQIHRDEERCPQYKWVR